MEMSEKYDEITIRIDQNDIDCGFVDVVGRLKKIKNAKVGDTINYAVPKGKVTLGPRLACWET